MFGSVDLVSSVRDFCAKSKGFSIAKLFQKQKPLADLVDQCLSSAAAEIPLKRWAIVQDFSTEFSQQVADLDKVKSLKRGLCEKGKNSNWKGALLGAAPAPLVDIHTLFLQYPNSLNLPIGTRDRTKLFSYGDIQAVCGSTFATNIPERIDEKGHHILDGVCSYLCKNNQGLFNGYALAIGDGAGGHFGDNLQDKMIGRAAHFAARGASRLLSAYHDPDKLLEDLSKIIEVLKKEILLKAKGESTTLACCRAFPVEGGFRVVGFNLGDNMVVAWNPLTKTATHLLPSRCSEAGTALFPEGFRAFEVQIVDTILPNGCLLYLMTDGVHDTLPFIEEERVYPNQLTYRVRTLKNLESILGDFPETTSGEIFMQAICQESFAGAERLRQGQNNANTKIGDDFSLIQCHLKKP